MTNEEKARKLAIQSTIDVDDNGNEIYNALVEAALLEMAKWKDEQAKQLLIDKTKLLSSSAAQDSVKRCTIEEIYRELFNEEIPNSNPYIK